jgi:hypothetical protein
MIIEEKNRHLIRPSYFEAAEKRVAEGQQLGFDYRGKLYEKSISPLILADKKRNSIISKMDKLMVFLVDSVKNIKKTFNYAVQRNSRDIN